MRKSLNIYDIIKLTNETVKTKDKDFYKDMTSKDQEEFNNFIVSYTANAIALVIEDIAGDFEAEDRDVQKFLKNSKGRE